MKIKMFTNGNETELKEAAKNGMIYVSHQELKDLAKEDNIMFDFPYINAATAASAMCVISNMQGRRCYGTGQAQTLAHATDLAFDNAMIDLYGIGVKSCVEYEIIQAAKKAATDNTDAEEAAAKKTAAEKKAIDDAAKKKATQAEEVKKAEEAKKAAAAKKATEEAISKNDAPVAQSTSYENNPDWVGCHSLTPEDPGDVIINYGPFKQTADPSPLKPGPKYLSQVLKYRAEYIEKVLSVQPPAFVERIPQFLTYCERHGIGLHAINDLAHNILVQYGVKEL